MSANVQPWGVQISFTVVISLFQLDELLMSLRRVDQGYQSRVILIDTQVQMSLYKFTTHDQNVKKDKFNIIWFTEKPRIL